MSKGPLDRIAALLTADAPEKQIAAAIVLGELRASGPEVVRGLGAMLESGSPPLQRHALEALARIRSVRALPQVLALLGARDPAVRAAAGEAVAALGDEAVPKVKARLAEASGDERRALEVVLARLGGTKEAVSTLLTGLESTDPETARAVALEVRSKVRDADAKTRKLWLGEVLRVLEKMRKAPPPSPVPIATCLKILGYLEDPKTTETLLAYARDERAPFGVRQEALIALRFALADDAHAGAVVDAMVAAAEAPDRMLAQAALMSLAAVELPAKHAARVARLCAHPDPERARIALEKLARQPGAEVTRALVEVVRTQDRRRGEQAAQALVARPDAPPLLAEALLEETDADRCHALRTALRGHARGLGAALRERIVAAAAARAASGEAGWESLVDVAREADGAALAEALREALPRLAKAKKEDRLRAVLGLLARSEHGSDEDRYRLAALELRASRKDTRPAARAEDAALQLLGRLSRSAGFDVGAALRKDKSLDEEALFFAGFHFAEEGHPLGAELLAEVVRRAPRTKLGKAAKNKLALAERGAG